MDEAKNFEADGLLDSCTARIVKFIDWLQINKNQFAASIDINQAVLSHVLNGRNKPSLDVIKKILIAYPQLNPDWLLLGHGDMFRIGNDKVQQELIFDDSQPNPPVSQPNPPVSQPNPPVQDKINVDSPKRPQMKSSYSAVDNSVSRPVKALLFIYEDNTTKMINF